MLKARQKLGKYRIVRRLAKGGFAAVYEARDTVEGIHVALKVPHPEHTTPEMLDTFRKEVRLVARLDHPSILPIKTAGHVDGRFIIAQPLGKQTLHDRLRRRVSLQQALTWTEQILGALAHAHAHHIVHCDVKPENLLLFPGGRLRLCDFGISRVALRTVAASGAGTVGYIAPEQAMGRPSKASDVFSAGLVSWQMLTGHLPEWPFHWPLPGHTRLKKLHPDLTEWLLRCLEVETSRRFRDARAALATFRRVKPKVLQARTRRLGGRRKNRLPRDWKQVRVHQFLRRWSKMLATRHACERCGGPVSEAMQACAWCGRARTIHKGEVDFPARCPRCRRGVKLDWVFCPWCYGSAIGPQADRAYDDRRYAGRCNNRRCPRGLLMPFMRYCPWCRRKVRTHWPLEGSRGRCPRCRWGVVAEDWSACPWCAAPLHKARTHAH